MWCGHPNGQDIIRVNVEKWAGIGVGDEGCRRAGGAVLGLVEVKPHSSAVGQGGMLLPPDAQCALWLLNDLQECSFCSKGGCFSNTAVSQSLVFKA